MASKKNLVQFQSALTRRKKSRMLAVQDVANIAKLDIGRAMRKGIPEIILAEGKKPEQVASIAAAMAKRSRRVIISRANASHFKAIRSKGLSNYRYDFFKNSGVIIIKPEGAKIALTGGRVGILTAGTSDIPIAEEAKIIAGEMGCETREYNDVGVAGLHRLFKPLQELLTWDADVILVVAGREGALPTVVAGMVDVPVIGVPTSKSYGFGDKGIAALAAMLQSCSLGIAVVNIDSGVGAGAVGALIANRASSGRKE